MIGYQFKSTYDCGDYDNMIAYHATLMEAIAYCNGHANCNCIELDKVPDFPNLKNYKTYVRKSKNLQIEIMRILKCK